MNIADIATATQVLFMGVDANSQKMHSGLFTLRGIVYQAILTDFFCFCSTPGSATYLHSLTVVGF